MAEKKENPEKKFSTTSLGKEVGEAGHRRRCDNASSVKRVGGGVQTNCESQRTISARGSRRTRGDGRRSQSQFVSGNASAHKKPLL